MKILMNVLSNAFARSFSGWSQRGGARSVPPEKLRGDVIFTEAYYLLSGGLLFMNHDHELRVYLPADFSPNDFGRTEPGTTDIEATESSSLDVAGGTVSIRGGVGSYEILIEAVLGTGEPFVGLYAGPLPPLTVAGAV